MCAPPWRLSQGCSVSCGVLTPWSPAPQDKTGQMDWQAVPALLLIPYKVHDFPEEDYYWDLEVSSWGQKGGWPVLPRGFQESPSLLGFYRGPGPPSTNSKPTMRSFRHGDLEECGI